MREKFTFLKNFKDAADKLPDELRLKFYDAMTRYVFDSVEPDDAIICALLGAIKPSLDTEDKRGGARDGAGRKSKLIKINQNNQNEFLKKNENQNNSNEIKINQNNQKDLKERKEKKTSPLNPQEENKINKNILPPSDVPLDDALQIDLEEWLKEHDTSSAPKKFKKPTLVEVKTYMNDSGYAVSPERFIAYYDSIGWKVGKNPMKDWKAALRGWAIRERAREKTIQAAKCLYPGVGGTYGEGVPL